VPELKPTPSRSVVEWESLTSLGFPVDQWGYKIAVSREPCPQSERVCKSERKTDYFEVERLPVEPQRYIPYAQNLSFVPVAGVVWIGVGAVPVRGGPPSLLGPGPVQYAYSEEIEVPVVNTNVPGDPGPVVLWTEGDTVYWEGAPSAAGAYGYKVAVSDIPRCEATGNSCRLTDSFEVAKSGNGVQSFSPCLEHLGFKPVGDRVFVGVGTLGSQGTDPTSYTGSEVAVSVPPCPKQEVIVQELHQQQVVEKPQTAGPTPPVNSQVPSLAGTAAVGYLLTASPGAWQNPPNSYAYQWQICDAGGMGCQNISGAAGTTFPLTGGDFGHRLRVAVTAQNGGGSATAFSVPSPVIGSTVESDVEWSFGLGRSFTVVESLSLHEVTAGAHVEVVCRGARCPFKVADVTPVAHSSNCRSRRCGQTHGNATGSEAALGRLFKGRHLRPGTVIMVRVTKPGWVGRLYVFTVRANTRPSHPRPTCLAPDSTQASACVGGG
jgi:hypothetical protein